MENHKEIERRSICIKQKNEFYKLRKITADVPQESILGPNLYLLYTSDTPELPDATMVRFAGATAILSVAHTENEAKTR